MRVQVLPVMHPQLTRCSAGLVGEVRRGRGRWGWRCCAVSVGQCTRYGEVLALVLVRVLVPCVALSAWWA